MNELQNNEFDYSLVDESTAKKLKKYDKQLNQIYQNYTIEVGEVLYNAQQEFANPRDGNFIKWIEYKGFKRQNAYNYINIYETFQSLESNEQKDVFLKQSKSIQIEMSKPSAKEEVNQAVFDGDIKTHKEYKEMESKLKQAEQQAEAERRERERLEEENERLANQEPKVIEKVVEDKTKISELTKEINQLKIRLEQESNDAETYRKLRSDIERLSAKKDDMIRRIESAGTIGEFIARVERAFTEDLAPIKYTRAIRETSDSPAVIESVNSILETVEEWVAEIRREVPELKYYTEVIEHE